MKKACTRETIEKGERKKEERHLNNYRFEERKTALREAEAASVSDY